VGATVRPAVCIAPPAAILIEQGYYHGGASRHHTGAREANNAWERRLKSMPANAMSCRDPAAQVVSLSDAWHHALVLQHIGVGANEYKRNILGAHNASMTVRRQPPQRLSRPAACDRGASASLAQIPRLCHDERLGRPHFKRSIVRKRAPLKHAALQHHAAHLDARVAIHISQHIM
jgi:hypothetical protein